MAAVARRLRTPSLRDLLRRYLREQLYPGFDEPDAPVDITECPDLSPRTRVALHTSARATFYAPSELCGPGGMHSEMIRCSSRWFKRYPRYDTVFVRLSGAEGLRGMAVARVRGFLSFPYGMTMHECALVEWFELASDHPDPLTGLWVVKPEMAGNRRAVEVISTDSIVRASHLLAVHGRTRMPRGFHFSNTLNAFKRYFVNSYADYHTHELLS